MGVELIARLGGHTLDIDLLALTQVVLLLVGELHALNLVRDIDILGTHGHHLVGHLVKADERWDILSVATFEFHHSAHIACFEEVLLVLFREDMSEVRTLQFGLLADTVDGEYYLTGVGLLQRQACIGTQYGRAEVKVDRYKLVGLVAFEHRIKESSLLKILTRESEVLQLVPVDHRLVVTILIVLLLVVSFNDGLLGLIFLCHCF